MDQYLDKVENIPSPKRVYWGFILQNENATGTKETPREGTPIVWNHSLYYIYISPLIQQSNIPTRYGLLYSKHNSITRFHAKQFIIKSVKLSLNQIFPLLISERNYANQYLNTIFKPTESTSNETCTSEQTLHEHKCCCINIQLLFSKK